MSDGRGPELSQSISVYNEERRVLQFELKECSVVVGVRIRPFNDREKALNAQAQSSFLILKLSASFAWTLMVPPPFCRILLRWRWNLARARRQTMIIERLRKAFAVMFK